MGERFICKTIKVFAAFLIFVLFLLQQGGTQVKAEKESKELGEIKFYQLEKEYRKTVSRVFELKSASAVEIKPIVQRTLSIYGSAYVNEQTNTLYVTDVPEKIDDLIPFIEKLDVKGMTAGENLVTKVMPLNHTKASDHIEFITHKLSSVGKVYANPALNALLITDIESKIEELQKLIIKLDVPVKHISVDLVIVEISSDFFAKIGLDPLSWLGSISGYGSIYGGTRNDYWGISSDLDIGDIISLMISKGKGKVLANPRLITQNNKPATFASFDYIPYSYPSYRVYEATAKIGISVSVLPTVQEDGSINLSLTPVVSNLTGWSPKGVPLVSDRSLSTEIKVKDGEMFVLGGLRNQQKVKSRRGVPLLKDIPILKYLFSIGTEVEIQKETVLFVKPHILKEGEGVLPQERKLLEETQKEFGR